MIKALVIKETGDNKSCTAKGNHEPEQWNVEGVGGMGEVVISAGVGSEGGYTSLETAIASIPSDLTINKE